MPYSELEQKLERQQRVFVYGALGLIALAILVLGGLAYLGIQQRGVTQKIENTATAACEDSRILIQKVVLRTLNADYEDWRADPGKVLEEYRAQLETSPSLKDDPARVEHAVLSTHDILDLADPEMCE